MNKRVQRIKATMYRQIILQPFAASGARIGNFPKFLLRLIPSRFSLMWFINYYDRRRGQKIECTGGCRIEIRYVRFRLIKVRVM
jgi:hypothetical protein